MCSGIGTSLAARHCKKVDLPQPFCPIKPYLHRRQPADRTSKPQKNTHKKTRKFLSGGVESASFRHHGAPSTERFGISYAQTGNWAQACESSSTRRTTCTYLRRRDWEHRSAR